MIEIEADWVLAIGDKLWALMRRELPRLITHDQSRQHTLCLRLPGANLTVVVYEHCRLFFAPPEMPLDTEIKFLLLDLAFPGTALDKLHAECKGDVDKMCHEINRKFNAMTLN